MGEPSTSKNYQRLYRRAYRAGYRANAVAKLPQRLAMQDAVNPMEALDVLLSLDVHDPTTFPRLLKGLRWHIATGSLTANAASQIMRFAREEAEASPRAAQDDTALLSRLSPRGAGGENHAQSKSKDPTADTGQSGQSEVGPG